MAKPPIPNLSAIKRVESSLEFRWQNELCVQLAFTEMRFLCPCAHCVSEIDGKRIIARDSIADDIDLVDMQGIGNYAYRLLFSDGHDSGIYPLKYLHQLCLDHNE
ncbi:MAG: DUF971 family protein [Myxococcota bacterium]|jgi:DUF971 family protein